jgi:hypothetical protein
MKTLAVPASDKLSSTEQILHRRAVGDDTFAPSGDITAGFVSSRSATNRKHFFDMSDQIGALVGKRQIREDSLLRRRKRVRSRPVHGHYDHGKGTVCLFNGVKPRKGCSAAHADVGDDKTRAVDAQANQCLLGTVLCNCVVSGSSQVLSQRLAAQRHRHELSAERSPRGSPFCRIATLPRSNRARYPCLRSESQRMPWAMRDVRTAEPAKPNSLLRTQDIGLRRPVGASGYRAGSWLLGRCALLGLSTKGVSMLRMTSTLPQFDRLIKFSVRAPTGEAT